MGAQCHQGGVEGQDGRRGMGRTERRQASTLEVSVARASRPA